MREKANGLPSNDKLVDKSRGTGSPKEVYSELGGVRRQEKGGQKRETEIWVFTKRGLLRAWWCAAAIKRGAKTRNEGMGFHEKAVV